MSTYFFHLFRLLAFAFLCAFGSPLPAQDFAAQPEVVMLLNQAGQLAKDGKLQESLKASASALTKAQELKDKPGVALAWNATALVHRDLKQNEQALEAFQKVLALRRELNDKNREAVTLANIGWTLMDLTRFEDAATNFDKASPIFAELKDFNNLAIAYYGNGRARRELGEVARAIDYFELAALAYSDAKNLARAASVLQERGVLQWRHGDSKAALESLELSLDIQKKLGDRNAQAKVMSNLAFVHESSGRPAQAIAICQAALVIAREVNDRDVQTLLLNNLGKAYRTSGQQQKALKFYNEALALAREAGDKVYQAITISNIGSVYGGLGQHEKALEFYVEALALHRANKDRRGEATELNNVAAVLDKLGQTEKAIEYFTNSLELHRTLRDERGEAVLLSNLAGIHRTRGEYEKAGEMFQQAMLLHRKVDDRRGEAITLNNIALTLSQAGKSRESLADFRAALAINREVGDLDAESVTLTNLALAEQSLGQFDSAATHLKTALNIVEDLRGELGSLAAAKMSFLENKLHYYHIYIDLELGRKNTEEAFNWLEKTKARSLLDLMQSGPPAVLPGVSEADIQRLSTLRKQADALNQSLIAAQVRAMPDKEQIAALRKELRETESDLQTLRDTLQAQHPELAKARASDTVTLQQVAQFLPTDTALLNFAVLKTTDLDKLFLLCTTIEDGKARVVPYEIPLKRHQLVKLIEEFRAVSSDPKKDYRPKARELYGYLVAPAEKQLAGKARLAICPDGPLWGLPFQSLLINDGPTSFLWQRYDIAYCYSATVLQTVLRERARQGQSTPGAAKTLLALANPDFGGPERFGGAQVEAETNISEETRAIIATSRALIATSRAIIATSREAGAFMPTGAIAPLPGTQQEADAIRADFPTASILTGKQASEAALKARGGEFRYLHFATHGLLNDTAPMLSCIVMANPQSDDEDGFLTGREIADLRWNAEMVVFSACDTGRGQERGGEGIIGLTWAAFVAGAPTQVVSQWAVNDNASAEFMKLFYAGLKADKGKSAALRNAAMGLMKQTEYSHPYYWAPFILLGDWQ